MLREVGSSSYNARSSFCFCGRCSCFCSCSCFCGRCACSCFCGRYARCQIFKGVSCGIFRYVGEFQSPIQFLHTSSPGRRSETGHPSQDCGRIRLTHIRRSDLWSLRRLLDKVTCRATQDPFHRGEYNAP